MELWFELWTNINISRFLPPHRNPSLSDLSGVFHEKVVDQYSSREGLLRWLHLSLLPGQRFILWNQRKHFWPDKTFYLYKTWTVVDVIDVTLLPPCNVLLIRSCLNTCVATTSVHEKKFSNLQRSSTVSNLKMTNPTFLQFPRCFGSWSHRISFVRCHQMTGKG